MKSTRDREDMLRRGMREPVYSVQVVRALAATLVVMVHLGRALQLKAGIDPTAVTFNGTMGVDIFFVVSGFVMVHTTPRAFSPREFLSRRFVRLAPLYWLLTLIYGTALLAAPHLSQHNSIAVGNFLLAFAFLPSHGLDGNILPPLEQGWTLAYEMFFYVCFAVVSWLVFGRRIVALAIVFAALIICGLLLPFGHNAAFATYTDPILLEFLFGCILGSAYPRMSSDAGRPTTALLVVVTVLCAGASPFLMAQNWPRVIYWGVPAVLVVWSFLRLERSVTFQHMRLLQAMGDSSYSLYLTHVMVLSVLALVFRIHGLQGLPALLLAPLFLGVCVIAGWFCHRLIERPLTRAARRWFEGARPRQGSLALQSEPQHLPGAP
jgi:peptidoglycan/LPS O-acetylase OafA/YrhL